MPPARRSSTTKSTARRAGKSATRSTGGSAARSASGAAARATKGVRARAASTSAATRREVEQSITRFEKRLEDANDALSTLGKHLGRGATSSYKEVTAALRALRRDAAKTNKQALKDFDKLRGAVTHSSSTSRSTSARKTSARPASTRKTSARKTSARKTTARAAGSRSTTSRSTTSRKTASRSRAKKS
jgi:hypothetical protein